MRAPPGRPFSFGVGRRTNHRVENFGCCLSPACPNRCKKQQEPQKTPIYQWRPVGESNPCYRRERAVSWASRRTGLKAEGRVLGYASDAAVFNEVVS